MFRHLLTTSTLCLAASLASAQSDFTFQLNQGLSAFTWSGNTSLGAIVENPANFNLAGTVVMNMGSGGSPVGSGAFNGGDALVTPNLSGTIPNPFPFLPDLASMTLSNAHVRVNSPSFSVNAAGAFSTTVTMTIIQGLMDVTTLTGGASQINLAGMVTTPAAASGTLKLVGDHYSLVSPVSGVFPFTDPGSGVSGSLTLNGTVHGNFFWTPPTSYCPGLPNSVGPGAVMTASGSPSLGTSNLLLNTVGLPTGQFGVYFYGPNQLSLPFGNGLRCVGGQIIRLAPINSGPSGTTSRPIGNASLPASGQLSVGMTRNFQFWHRDPAAGGAAFNLSNGVSVTFTP
jgi:hypothetical protein